MSWRTGEKVALNVYDGDRPVCQCHRDSDATLIAVAVNAWDDAAIAHRWFAKHFGEVMNGRDFSAKCQMADRMIKDGWFKDCE